MTLHTLHHGDCLEVLRTLPDCSVDACVTDPPYGLRFMGKAWDYDVPTVEVWREVLRVLKPGGYLLAFAGTRTQHRMACAIEDAGFEIRDMIAWVYGSGFPKSLDVSKAIDRAAGAEREVVSEYMGATNIGKASEGKRGYGCDGNTTSGTNRRVFVTAPATPEAQQWSGWGTALKPSLEPITVARKPLSGTVAENVLRWGTGGINVDGCRVGSEGGCQSSVAYVGGESDNCYGKGLNDQRSPAVEGLGRFPANLIHDGSDEVVGLLTDAARFFYTAKASAADRKGSRHPTVKPLDLMRYLCRLVTPPGGIVLDPFMGSGTTIEAALSEGFQAIGIEREAEYFEDTRRRLDGAQLGLSLGAPS